MIMSKLASIGLAASLVAILPAVPSQAQSPRTFLSAAGSDSNTPCANVTTPCRHFATAFAATAPSGEIFVLDPANYGSLTITHAVSIEGHGWASIAPPSNGNAITINAGSGDSISIHGVAINGTGATGGTNGIVFNSGASLSVTDCVIQNFLSTGAQSSGNGILMQPSAGTVRFVITNTTILNNGYAGISYLPPSGSSATANGVIDHVVATNNIAYGIGLFTLSGGGSTTVAISNSIVSDTSNGAAGVGLNIWNGSAALTVSIDNTSITHNPNGIFAAGTANVMLGRSVITANNVDGVDNATSPNTFFSYQDNRINGNGMDVAGNPLNSHPLK